MLRRVEPETRTGITIVQGGGDAGRVVVVVVVVHYHRHPRLAASEYAVLVNVSPRTDLTWLAIIK